MREAEGLSGLLAGNRCDSTENILLLSFPRHRIAESFCLEALVTARIPSFDNPQTFAQTMAHIVLRTTRPDAMADWYRKVLGAETTFRSERLHFVTFDNEHHRLVFLRVPESDPAPMARTTVDHWAYTLPSLAALLNRYDALKQSGIRPYWCINHGLSTSLYYADPDGNRVELQVDNLPDREAVNRWFATGAFDANPIGVTFDPDEMLRELERGASEAEMLIPHRLTPGSKVGLAAILEAEQAYAASLGIPA
jgi:catechol-2,3-dioxygenase